MPFEIALCSEELSEEAKELLCKMMPKYKERIRQIKNTPVSVLIWGPTPTSDSIIAQIRRHLRQILRQEGNLAMFSEEICDDNCGISLRLQQLIQAEQYDLIISIPETPGSIAEIHDFASDVRVNRKILIFLNEDFSEGYSAQSLRSISCLLSAEIITYSSSSVDTIILNSLSTVNRIREYNYMAGGRY